MSRAARPGSDENPGIHLRGCAMSGYGTVFRVRLRPEATEEQLRAHLERWQRELGPRFPGSLTDLLLKVDGEERDYLVVHLFASREAYAAMDGDAPQDAWYRSLV